MISGFHTQRDQCAGKRIYVVTEFGVGTGIIHGRIFKGQLIGEFFHHFIQYLRERFINKNILFPDEFSAACLIAVKMIAHAGGTFEFAHDTDKVREDNFHIINIVFPVRIPFQRDKSTVVNGAQRIDHFAQRQGTFANQAIFQLPIRHF